MAIVVRYFSTSGAGDADGTSWANRAALLSSGNWSSVITGHDFANDSLVCWIEGGLTYTCSQTLNNTTITTDPTVTTRLFLMACDSAGEPLAVPNPSWDSAAPLWDTSGMPVISTSTNIETINGVNIYARLIVFTGTGRTDGAVVTSSELHWCHVKNSASGTNARATSGAYGTNNCLETAGTTYSFVATITTYGKSSNWRVVGAAGSSGNRDGVIIPPTSSVFGTIDRVTVVGCGGRGIVLLTSAATNGSLIVTRCLAAGCGGTGIVLGNTTSPTNGASIVGCISVGNGGYGIDGGTGSHTIAYLRTRDNTSGRSTSMENMPDIDPITSAGTDADEFVDASNGDYRIRYGSALWGKGIGAGDEPPQRRRVFIG